MLIDVFRNLYGFVIVMMMLNCGFTVTFFVMDPQDGLTAPVMIALKIINVVSFSLANVETGITDKAKDVEIHLNDKSSSDNNSGFNFHLFWGWYFVIMVLILILHIVMLNFVIAVVGETYQIVKDLKEQYCFKYKAQMNLEASYMLMFFNDRT